MAYKRKHKTDYGDYNRKHKHMPYGWKGTSEYSGDDKAIIPVVNNTSVRMKVKNLLKNYLDE